ncbi:MAG TPA: hypothetical protein PLZ05_03125 [Alphaproteobacteria bacterium]|nr:hypothetical protein [Alphaproteobacteria bacterium]
MENNKNFINPDRNNCRYKVIPMGGNIYEIVGCEAGNLYGNSVIVNIFDTRGNSGWYLYMPQIGLYKKVDISLPEFKKYPLCHFKLKNDGIENHHNALRRLVDILLLNIKLISK